MKPKPKKLVAAAPVPKIAPKPQSLAERTKQRSAAKGYPKGW